MATSPESFRQHDSIGSAESISNCANSNSNSAEVVNTDETVHTPTDSVVVPPLADTDSDFNATQSEKHAIQAQEQHLSLDDIPEPIKVLDDIISEFEDTSKPPSIAGANGENQSEDDGYMSLSRKNMHKKDFENVSQSSIGSNSVPPAATPSKEFREFEPGFAHSSNEHAEVKEAANKAACATDSAADQNLIQSTLPKARPASAITTNYSSLPCCGVRSTSMDSKLRGVSCNGERNVLGIDISAVHNAVLRGGLAKLPEPILNEHPVTIYPGRYSPPSEGKRSNRPHRLLSSVEKHKQVCHILNPLSSISSSSSSTSSSHSAGLTDTKGTDISPLNNITKMKPYMHRDNEHKFRLVSEDDFSDDSIEEASLSPITTQSSPQKSAGIAWEIHFKSNKKKSKTTSKKKQARKPALEVASKTENGISAATKNDAYLNTDISRAFCEEPEAIDEYDGPDKCSPPSADILNYCMYRHTNMLGKGTFIIRRSNKKPPKAMDIFKNDVQPSSLEDEGAQALTEDLLVPEPNEIYKQEEVVGANSRHSLELAAAAQGPSLASPRDRLSLNLEPQLPNSYNKEISAPYKADRTPTEEFSVSTKKGSVKRDIQKQSTESINTKSSSFEEVDEEQASEATDLNVNASNVFSYKSNNANGLKNQEFNELRSSNTTTPHTDLAPTLEEEEEQYSDFSYGCAPLKQIENNISALLRGEIAVVRVGDGAPQKRPLEFRPGVHKSESAKEMLLSQNALGPLPPSPPSSNPDLFDYDAMPPLPPLPPSPKESTLDNSRSLVKGYLKTTAAEIHTPSLGEERRNRDNISAMRYLSNDLPALPPPAFENLPPAVPPHRGHSANTVKSWSIDSNYKKKSPKMLSYGSGITTPTGSQGDGSYSTKRYVSYGTKRSLKQSPREELRLQTSCSLPETPIFARGCDIPRTPFRRQNESAISGSRTAPRSSTSHSINMGTSIVGIAGGNTFGAGMCRQRSMNHALASNEMLRLSGAPARGWYPKQRSMRPASTENIDRLSSVRVWDSATGMSGTGHSRKPLTLPPNLTPSFLNKSPREALRRVTSLLIAKKKNTKERKPKPYVDGGVDGNHVYELETSGFSAGAPSAKEAQRSFNNASTTQKPQKKKGLFKNLWKRTKHVSLDQ